MKKTIALLLIIATLFVSCATMKTTSKEQIDILTHKVYVSDTSTFFVNGKEVMANQVADTNLYYYSEDNLDYYVYGTSNLSYSQLYYGLINNIKSDADVKISKVNPSLDFDKETYCDAVTSATSKQGSHSKDYPSIINHIPGVEENDLMRIDGVKNIDTRISAKLYVEAILLSQVNDSYPLVKSFDKFFVNANPSMPLYSNNIFTLLADGSYSRPEDTSKGEKPVKFEHFNVKQEINYHDKYGDYVFEFKVDQFSKDENSPYYFNKYIDNVYAATIENSNNDKAPCVYYEDMWVEKGHFGELDLAVSNQDVNSKHHEFITSRFSKLFKDKTLIPGQYTITFYSKGYENMIFTVSVKEKVSKDNLIDDTDASFNKNGIVVMLDTTNLLEDYNIDSYVLLFDDTVIDPSTYSFNKRRGRLIIRDARVGVYDFIISNNKYQDIKVEIEIKSNLDSNNIKIENNKIIITNSDSDVKTYVENMGKVAITRDGEEKPFTKIKNYKTPFILEDGTIDLEFTKNGEKLFLPGKYILTIQSDGFETFDLEFVVK